MPTSPSQTTHGRALLDELRELGALRRDLQRRARLGGGLVALSVLDRLGPARVSKVADELQVDLSVASRQVAALHAAGYVTRVPDPRDGRSQQVKLTAAGKRALRKAQERSVEVLDGATRDWTDAEVDTLVAGLRRLREDYLLRSLEGA
ncbi:MAG TPA: MarR family transcriptional regulator [Thermoleophilaceae bacterium]|nr:MarR family transcriptional regulator [Thermoleophilaceae bacterium]